MVSISFTAVLCTCDFAVNFLEIRMVFFHLSYHHNALDGYVNKKTLNKALSNNDELIARQARNLLTEKWLGL